MGELSSTPARPAIEDADGARAGARPSPGPAVAAGVSPVRPAVSVIVPTFQRRDYVCRAVKSVLKQTFQEFEVIVVDDGSSDGTEQAVEELRLGDARIRFRRQEHSGVSTARNTGVRAARGDVVAFLDSDDRWLPDHLEVVMDVLGRHPDVVLVSTCPAFRIAGRRRPRFAEVVDALPACLTENVIGYQSCVAVRRRELLRVGGFDERLRVMEGAELWPRLAAQGRFALLRRRTIIRQATPGSLMECGRLDGSYVRVLEPVAESALELASALDRPDREALVERACGRRAFAKSLLALARDDEAAAAEALREACGRLPQLSQQPLRVIERLWQISPEEDSFRRHLTMYARIWPDPSARAAVFLRLRAAAAEFRARDLRSAASLLAGVPLRAWPAFLLRTFPDWTQLVRRASQSRLRIGADDGGRRQS